jgi:hypothetical protein
VEGRRTNCKVAYDSLGVYSLSYGRPYSVPTLDRRFLSGKIGGRFVSRDRELSPLRRVSALSGPQKGQMLGVWRIHAQPTDDFYVQNFQSIGARASCNIEGHQGNSIILERTT